MGCVNLTLEGSSEVIHDKISYEDIYGTTHAQKNVSYLYKQLLDKRNVKTNKQKKSISSLWYMIWSGPAPT